jgi:acyl-coenzyme A thioesterase PaaI-like protein
MIDEREPGHPFTPPPGYRMVDWRRGYGGMVGPFYERFDGKGGYSRGFLVEDRHTNGMKNAHGGMLMGFADVAFGHVVSVERSTWWVTVRLTCDFLFGAQLGEFVEGSGEILGETGGLFTVRGRIWVGERTIMTGMGVFKAIEERPPRPGEKAFKAG